MPHLSSYVFRRGVVFYWRKRLSRPLDALLGRSHYTISLGTSDRRLAARMSRALLDVLDGARDHFTVMPHSSVTRELVEQAIEQTAAKVIQAIIDGNYQSAIAFGANPVRPSWKGSILSSLHASWTSNNADMVAAELKDVLSSEFGVELSQKGREFAAIARAVVYAILNSAADELKLDEQRFEVLTGGAVSLDGDKVEALLKKVFGPQRQSEQNVSASALKKAHSKISIAAQEYISSREKLGGVRKNTLHDDRRSLDVFIQLMDDLPLHKIDRDVALSFREALLSIPARNGRDCYLTPPDPRKSKGRRIGYPLPLRGQIELCKDIDDTLAMGKRTYRLADGRVLNHDAMEAATELLSPATANKYLTFFTGFWQSEFVPSHLREKSPFQKIHYRKKSGTGGEDSSIKRKHFRQEDLELLFGTPVWTGNKNSRFRTQTGSKIYWDARYWVPIVALYSGMRREEICQLSLGDLDEVDGVKFFSLRPSRTMKLKSGAAARDIPIHPELMRLGFNKYLDDVHRAKAKRLFPELQRSKSHDTYGESVGKWFYTYRNALGIYDPVRDLHSMRTTFLGTLATVGVSERLIDTLAGHASDSVAATNYRKPFSIKQLAAGVEAFDVKVDALSRVGRTIISLDSSDHPFHSGEEAVD